MPEIFEEQVAIAPEAVALESGAVLVSYAEMNERADRVSRQLAAHGVRTGSQVGILMGRSVDLVVTLLAVAKLWPIPRLARLEGQIAFGTLLRRVPFLELAVREDELSWVADSSISRGLERLPVRIEGRKPR